MQNRKGIGIVTVLAFLALALILFAGMAITFQTSAAREASEFDEQQVLLMAQSYSELVNGKLSSDEELQKSLIENASSGNLISNSEIKDISTSVKYDAGSLACSETVDEITTTVVCTLPVDIETTSTLSRISRKPVSRTIKNTAEITRTTVTTTAGGQTSGLGDYPNYALVTKLNEDFEYIEDYPGAGTGYLVEKNNHKKILIRVDGKIETNADFSKMNVSPLPTNVDISNVCAGNTITSSCTINTNLTQNTITIKAEKNGNNDNPLFVVITNDIVLSKVNLNVDIGVNQSVIFYLKDDLTLDTTKIRNINKEGLILIMSDEDTDLTIRDKTFFEGMVYLPKGSVEDETKANNENNAFLIGVVITKELDFEGKNNSTLAIVHQKQNTDILCTGITYCPFPSEEGTGGTGEVTTTTSYSSGGIKYAK